ncbi:MAG: arylsulfatase [Haliea sp.]|uniref:arylsulfatase n=1 Tax=Haliea sp. TaxID=1932666 RepID=UPI0032EBE2EC
MVVLLDDVGFGAASTFGGPIHTPTLEQLAERGLRYNRFHTTALCSPTRASLLTGRDPHVANVGAVINSSNAYEGYQGILRPETASVAELLRSAGYGTALFGKWHLVPDWEASPIGPFDRWPRGQGFEKFYGFLGGETDQFEPTLYQDTTAIRRPPGANYHLTEDLAEQAERWIRLQNSLAPGRPFFLYFAPGATHAPLQVPEPWISRYRGAFKQGWDALREETFRRQKALGVIPAAARLTARHEGIPAWDSLGPDEQIVAARMMETFAGFLSHTDSQVGRIVDTLQTLGLFDNTLFIYLVGDNGGEGAAGADGSINYLGALQGMQEPLSRQLDQLDAIGGPDSFALYPAGWAWATNTPFQWVKQIASHLGGTRTPMVVSWPRRIQDHGGLRSQFSHVNDIAPTILDAVGLTLPETVSGARQLPMDGASLLPSFTDPEAPEHKHTQYFEVHGHRSIYHEGWMASARHSMLPWDVGLPVAPTPFADDVWELYHLEQDFSQSEDLAQARPDKLRSLQALFHSEAERVGILPLRNALAVRGGAPLPSLRGDRQHFTYYEGAIAIPESGAPGMLNRSWELAAELVVASDPGGPPRGVIATLGGSGSGWSLYLDAEGRPVFEYRVFEAASIRIAGKHSLLPGEHRITLGFDYDGGGYGQGGLFTLKPDDESPGQQRTPATPPGFFSIDETFDIGVDTGSPAGSYPADSPAGYHLTGARIERVTIELR